jgi:hypothetical protein
VSEQRLYPGKGPDERTSFAPYSAFEIPEDLRELHGRYDVEATARRVRNFRYTHEWMTMMMGGWLATVPELPVKTGLGKIIWESAQAADALGKRLPELRAGRNPATASQPANEGFAALIQEVALPESPEQTIEKLGGLFDVLMPHLVAVYEHTMQETDPICDDPTIELLDEATRKLKRHIAWGAKVLEQLCDSPEKRERRAARERDVRERLEACGGVTGELP